MTMPNPGPVRMWGVWCDDETRFLAYRQYKQTAAVIAAMYDEECDCKHRVIPGTFTPDELSVGEQIIEGLTELRDGLKSGDIKQ